MSAYVIAGEAQSGTEWAFSVQCVRPWGGIQRLCSWLWLEQSKKPGSEQWRSTRHQAASDDDDDDDDDDDEDDSINNTNNSNSNSNSKSKSKNSNKSSGKNHWDSCRKDAFRLQCMRVQQ